MGFQIASLMEKTSIRRRNLSAYSTHFGVSTTDPSIRTNDDDHAHP